MIPGTPSLNIVVQLWTKWSQQFRMHERFKNVYVVQRFELGPLGSTHWLQGEGRAFMGICSEMQLWQITLTHKLAQRMHTNKCRHFRKHAGHLLACAWIPNELNFPEVCKHHCQIWFIHLKLTKALDAMLQQLLCRSASVVIACFCFCSLRLLALPSLQPPSLPGWSWCILPIIFASALFLFLFSLRALQGSKDVPQVGLGELDVQVFRLHGPQHSAPDWCELRAVGGGEWRQAYLQVLCHEELVVFSRLPEPGHRLTFLDGRQHVSPKQGSAGIMSSVCIYVPRHVYKLSQTKTEPYMWHLNVFYNPTCSQRVLGWVAPLAHFCPPDHIQVVGCTGTVPILGLASHQQTQGRIWLGDRDEGPAMMLLDLRKPPALVNRDLVHSHDANGARAPTISIAVLLTIAITIASSCHCKYRADSFQQGLGLCIGWSNLA